MKYFSKTIFIVILFIFFSAPSLSFAADLYLTAPATLSTGQNFEVLVGSNNDGVLINSINLTIDYNEDLVTFSGYKNEDTISPLWLESPRESGGHIHMSGIIPGGASGLYNPKKESLDTLPLVRLLFTAKREGNANFSFTKTEILKHDGSGTQLTYATNGKDIFIQNNLSFTESLQLASEILDNEKPHPFTLTFLESREASNTPSMVVFQAIDSGSGIKEYKIQEGGSTWSTASSPHPVSKKVFPYTLTVRAYDFYGNFQDANVLVPGIIPTPYLITLVIVLVLFCIWLYKMLKYNHGR